MAARNPKLIKCFFCMVVVLGWDESKHGNVTVLLLFNQRSNWLSLRLLQGWFSQARYICHSTLKYERKSRTTHCKRSRRDQNGRSF
jgi:hypothetical protein